MITSVVAYPVDCAFVIEMPHVIVYVETDLAQYLMYFLK